MGHMRELRYLSEEGGGGGNTFNGMDISGERKCHKHRCVRVHEVRHITGLG